MAKKIRITVHVSEPFDDADPEFIPNCLSSEGCAGSGSSIGSGSRGGGRFTVYEGDVGSPSIEIAVVSPLSSEEPKDQ